MKKVLCIFTTLVVVTSVVIKVVSVWNKEAFDDDNKYMDIDCVNNCIALDYHRVRDKNIWNMFVQNVIGIDELKHYSVYTEEFEKQMDRLIDEGAYFATLDEIETFRSTGKFPDKCVWICFDDCDKTLYENAYPILKKRNIPFTVFVIAGQVGNEDFSNISLCDWEDLKEMRDSGLASFGSHTYNMHYFEDKGAKFLDKDLYNDFYEDIKKSKEVLEEKLDVKITSIAYPFGESSDELAHLSEEAGFKNGFILAPYPITSDNYDFYQNRYMIDRGNFNSIMDVWLN